MTLCIYLFEIFLLHFIFSASRWLAKQQYLKGHKNNISVQQHVKTDIFKSSLPKTTFQKLATCTYHNEWTYHKERLTVTVQTILEVDTRRNVTDTWMYTGTHCSTRMYFIYLECVGLIGTPQRWLMKQHSR